MGDAAREIHKNRRAYQPAPPPPITTGNIADGDFRIDPERARNEPGKAQSAISKAEFKLFDTQFKPLLDDALKAGTSPGFVQAQGDRAGARIRKLFEARDGRAEREISRTGQRITEDQQENLDRNSDIQRALAIASGENNARVDAKATQKNLLEGAFDIGSSFLKSGGSSLSGAARLKSTRERQNEQIDAQQDARTLSTIGTIAGIAMAL